MARAAADAGASGILAFPLTIRRLMTTACRILSRHWPGHAAGDVHLQPRLGQLFAAMVQRLTGIPAYRLERRAG
jgi:hypothetical protein